MPDSTERDAARRVARGAALLDRRRPHWQRLVDVGALEMLDPAGCVLARVYGACRWGLEALGLSHADAARHGFVAAARPPAGGWDAAAAEYDALTGAWVVEVARRLLRDTGAANGGAA